MRFVFLVALTFAACSKPSPVVQKPEPVEPQPKEAVQTKPAGGVAEIRDTSKEPTRTAPTGKATIQHLAKGENAYFGKLTMAPGATVPVHRDSTEEYLYLLSGGGAITIDGVQSQVGPGVAVFMPANAEVSYINGDIESVFVQVFAGPEPSDKYGTWQVVGE